MHQRVRSGSGAREIERTSQCAREHRLHALVPLAVRCSAHQIVHAGEHHVRVFLRGPRAELIAEMEDERRASDRRAERDEALDGGHGQQDVRALFWHVDSHAVWRVRQLMGRTLSLTCWRRFGGNLVELFVEPIVGILVDSRVVGVGPLDDGGELCHRCGRGTVATGHNGHDFRDTGERWSSGKPVSNLCVSDDAEIAIGTHDTVLVAVAHNHQPEHAAHWRERPPERTSERLLETIPFEVLVEPPPEAQRVAGERAQELHVVQRARTRLLSTRFLTVEDEHPAIGWALVYPGVSVRRPRELHVLLESYE